MGVGRCSPQLPPAFPFRARVWGKSGKKCDISGYFCMLHYLIDSAVFILILIELILINLKTNE